MDGVEPNEANIRDFRATVASEITERARKKRARDVGFRVVALVEWQKVVATYRYASGQEKCDFEEQRLREHIREIGEVSVMLRAALRRPDTPQLSSKVLQFPISGPMSGAA
jgi:hypothetical protein